jgi:8-oxo-dGTP pyrophosphatase MutT (NUDIX family)
MDAMNHPTFDGSQPPWPETEREILGRYKIFDLEQSLRRSPTTGRQHRFLRLTSPDWVNVIAVTTGGDLLLVEQFRNGTDRMTLEIPGGAVDHGETPQGAGERELEEETGYRAGEVIQLGSVDPNPAFMSNACWTYLALDCEESGMVNPDPSEEIVVHRVPVGDFTRLIDAGSITHSLVIAAHDHLQRGIRRGLPWVHRLPLDRTEA